MWRAGTACRWSRRSCIRHWCWCRTTQATQRDLLGGSIGLEKERMKIKNVSSQEFERRWIKRTVPLPKLDDSTTHNRLSTAMMDGLREGGVVCKFNWEWVNLFDSEREKRTISYLRGLKTPSSAPRCRHRAGFKPVVVVCNKTAMMTGPRGGGKW